MRVGNRRGGGRPLAWALLLAALVIWGCAPAAPSPTAPAPADSAAAAGAGWQAEWERTLAEAKREGVVSVNIPLESGPREGVMAFQQAYPDIRLELTAIGAGDWEPRAEAERNAGVYTWDVYLSGLGAAVFVPRIAEGWFDPLKPLLAPEILDDSKWLGGFDAGFLDKGKTYVHGFNLYLQNNVLINHEYIPESAIERFSDLLKPEFKGKITALDPARPSGGSGQLTLMYKALGAEGITRLFREQQPVPTNDRRQIAEWVIRGRFPIGIGVSDNAMAPFLEQGLGKQVKPIRNPEVLGAGSGTGNIVAMSRAPHPNARKVFVNWFLSQQGQAAYTSKGLYNSRRNDVAPGHPEQAADPALADRYFNSSNEENGPIREELLQLVQRVMQ
jgi:iron(III) transport system substrate-binding protein